MKVMEQLGTELRGETGLSRDRYLELAQNAASQVQGVAVLDVLPRGVILGVKKLSKTIAAFEAVTLVPEDDQASDRVKVLVQWTDETTNRALSSNSGASARLFKAYVSGVPGFATYQSYLAEFKRILLAEDQSATLAIQTDED